MQRKFEEHPHLGLSLKLFEACPVLPTRYGALPGTEQPGLKLPVRQRILHPLLRGIASFVLANCYHALFRLS